MRIIAERAIECVFAMLVVASHVVSDKGVVGLILAGMIAFGAIMSDEYMLKWFKLSRPHFLLFFGSAFWIFLGI